MEFGTSFFNEFTEDWAAQNGYRLSATLSPEVSTEKLRKIWRSQNAHTIKAYLKRGLYNAAPADGLGQEEAQAWAEVYSSYWTAVGALLTARESDNDNSRVSDAEEVQAIGLFSPRMLR